VGKPDVQRSLGRPRHRWEDNTGINLQEVGYGEGMEWIDLAQGRDKVVGSCKRGNEPSGFIKCGNFLD
jgi:hypothetical protein